MGLREDGDGGRAKEVWAQKVLAGTAGARLSPGLATGFDGSGTADCGEQTQSCVPCAPKYRRRRIIGSLVLLAPSTHPELKSHWLMYTANSMSPLHPPRIVGHFCSDDTTRLQSPHTGRAQQSMCAESYMQLTSVYSMAEYVCATASCSANVKHQETFRGDG